MTSKKTSHPKSGPKPTKKPNAGRSKTSQVASAADAPTTLAAVAEGYLAHLQEAGKTPATIASYRADLGVALRHFTPETAVAGITPKQVEAFNASAAVTKTRAGKPKAKPGVDKTRRVLRLALGWAAATGLIAEAPLVQGKAQG